MKTFKAKWNRKSVQDDGAYMSKEAKSFVTAFKNMLKRELSGEGFNIVKISPNHYDLSGFIEKDGRYCYIAYTMPRWGEKIDFSDNGAARGVMYRVAKNDRDFRGGHNNFSAIENLPDALRSLYDNERRWQEVM